MLSLFIASSVVGDATSVPKYIEDVRLAEVDKESAEDKNILPAKYMRSKNTELVMKNGARIGNFVIGVVPSTPEGSIAGEISKWNSKRYGDKRKKREAKKIIKERDDKLTAMLIIGFVGNMMSDGKKSLSIPDDICNYIFHGAALLALDQVVLGDLGFDDSKKMVKR